MAEPEEFHTPGATPAGPATRSRRASLGLDAPPLLELGPGDRPSQAFSTLVSHLAANARSPALDAAALLGPWPRDGPAAPAGPGPAGQLTAAQLEAAFASACAAAARRRGGSESDSSSASDDPPYRVQMLSTGNPSSAQSVGFEYLVPISGEDAEELDKWFASLEWMITLKESNAKLGHYSAATLGRMMLGKLSPHSKAHDQLTAILTPTYYQDWDTWAGAATVAPVPAAAGPAEAPAAPPAAPAVRPIGDRLLAMIKDVQERLSQQLGHKMDHRRKAVDYKGINPDTGKPFPTPAGVMGRAKVLYQLVVKAGVRDLPESNYAWQMVEVLGDMFPMHASDLGSMLRLHLTINVPHDTLTLKMVAEIADKFYDTWRTYDNSISKAAKSARVNSLQEPAPPPAPSGQQPNASCNTCGSQGHPSRECFKVHAKLCPSYIPTMASEENKHMYNLWAASYLKELGFKPPLWVRQGRPEVIQWMIDTVPTHLLNGLAPGAYTKRRSRDTQQGSGGQGGNRQGGSGQGGQRHGGGGGRGGRAYGQPGGHQQQGGYAQQGGYQQQGGHQQQQHVNALAGWVPNPHAAPSEAGTVISMSDLRTVLQEMGVTGRQAAPAVNVVQQPQGPAIPPHLRITMLSMDSAEGSQQSDRVQQHALQQAANWQSNQGARRDAAARLSSLLVGFQQKPAEVADARAEQALYAPKAPTPLQAALQKWMLNQQEGVKLAHQVSQLSTGQALTVANVQMPVPASTETAPPQHMRGKRVALAYLTQQSAATGLTVYDKQGEPYLPDNVLTDCGAECMCLGESIARNSPCPLEPCKLKVKAFGDTEVHVIGKIRNYPMTFCRGTKHEVTVYIKKAYVFADAPSWSILMAQPGLQHHNLNMWVCGFLSAVVLWPSLHKLNPDTIWQLPAEERAQVLGDMVLLPCRMMAPEWREMDLCQLMSNGSAANPSAGSASVLKITGSMPSSSQPAAPPVYLQQFALEGDSMLPDPARLPQRIYYGRRWLTAVNEDELDMITDDYVNALTWYRSLSHADQSAHMSRYNSRDDRVDLWDYTHDGTRGRWQWFGSSAVEPGDVVARTQRVGDQQYRRYAEVLQSHQLRVLIAYSMRYMSLVTGAAARDTTAPLRGISAHPYGPHLSSAFRKEQWRHRAEEHRLTAANAGHASHDQLPLPDPNGFTNEPRLGFITRHVGGWPAVGDLPSALLMMDQWHDYVPAPINAELRDLYEVGMRLVQQYGQAFYESYGQRAFPNHEAEVWYYGNISGMQVYSQPVRTYEEVVARQPDMLPVGAWTRAQFLVISIATRRFGQGPARNNLPPPYGTMTLHPCWTSPIADDPPLEAHADYDSLRQQEWGF